MIKTLRYIYAERSWIVPAEEADEGPGAAEVEAFCPNGVLGGCRYYVFSLKPLPGDLLETVRTLLSLRHFAVGGAEHAVDAANALITVYNSDCRRWVEPAKLIYELARRSGRVVEVVGEHREDRYRRTVYYIEGVGMVRHIEVETAHCLIARRTIGLGTAEYWTF